MSRVTSLWSSKKEDLPFALRPADNESARHAVLFLCKTQFKLSNLPENLTQQSAEKKRLHTIGKRLCQYQKSRLLFFAVVGLSSSLNGLRLNFLNLGRSFFGLNSLRERNHHTQRNVDVLRRLEVTSHIRIQTNRCVLHKRGSIGETALIHHLGARAGTTAELFLERTPGKRLAGAERSLPRSPKRPSPRPRPNSSKRPPLPLKRSPSRFSRRAGLSLKRSKAIAIFLIENNRRSCSASRPTK